MARPDLPATQLIRKCLAETQNIFQPKVMEGIIVNKHIPTTVLGNVRILAVSALLALPGQLYATDALWDVLTGGKLDFSARYRFEHVDDDLAAEKARASTIRTTLGYTTGLFHAFNARLLLQDVRTVGPDDFNDGTGRPNAKTRFAAVNPSTDPISGQPASKHTPVMIEPVNTTWSGFYLSRDKHPRPPSRYWSRQNGYGYWCYEIAGNELPEDWSAWAKAFMLDDSSEDEWLEYCDATIGRYRAARIQDGKLISCLFIAPDHKQLPGKNWLQALFSEETLQKIQRACLLAGRSAGGGGSPGPVVCSCFSVGKNKIIQTILEKKPHFRRSHRGGSPGRYQLRILYPGAETTSRQSVRRCRLINWHSFCDTLTTGEGFIQRME